MDVPHQTYAFGEFVLDMDRGALQREGADLALRPKSFEVLRYLVERSGRLVTKDELLEAIWGPAVVSEGALTQCIIDIRKALSDDDHRFIKTVPRRGFIFEPVVLETGTGTDPQEQAVKAVPPVSIATPRGLPWIPTALLLAGGLAWWYSTGREPPGTPDNGQPIAHAASNSIAVLSFEDLSPGRDHQYLSDGIAEEILNLLTRAPGLQVVARTSSFSFRSASVDVPTIARRLGVRYLLEGSVRISGERVRVTAQLIDAATGMHLWSESFDRQFDDLFALQDEVARNVAGALHLRLAAMPAAYDGARNSRAHLQYLQGKFFYDRRGSGDVERAMAHYRRAVEIDATHARAWAGLAAAYGLLTIDGTYSAPEGLVLQGQAVERALALDPGLAEAQVRAAFHRGMSGRWDEANAFLARALELGPDNPLVLSAAAGRAAERLEFEAAIRLLQHAVEVDPLNFVNRNNLAQVLMAAGRHQESLTELQRLADIWPGQSPAHSLGLVKVLLGRSAEALGHFEQLPPGVERDFGLAVAFHALARQSDSDAAMRGLRQAWRPDSNIKTGISIVLAHAYRGEVDQAFHVLRTVDRRIAVDPLPIRRAHHLDEIRQSPFGQSLRQDPRWARWESLAKK